MTTDDIAQLKEILARLQQAIQNRERELDLLRDISGPEEIAQSEAMLAKLREKATALSGSGAIAQGGGDAIAATGEGSIAVGTIGRDLIANNKVEWLFVQIINQAAAPDPVEQRLQTLKQRYLRNLARDCDVLRLSDLGSNQEIGQEVRLSQVYIDLNTTAMTPLTDKEKQQGAYRFRDERPVSAMEAAAQNKYLALVGDPGGGKSTFVKQLTAWLAQAHLGDEEALAHLFGWTAGDWPFLLNLRDLAPGLASIRASGLSTETLEQQLIEVVEAGWRRQMERLGGPELAERLADLLAQERLLLIFDGLDEMAEGLHPLVRRAIDSLRRAPQMRIERIIVTSRVRSYTRKNALPGFERYTLRDFDGHQVGDFVTGWYGVQGQLNRWDKDDTRCKIDDLQQAITQDRHLFELAQNPLLLTVMAIIHQQDVRLPPQRVQLYNRAVQLLLAGWQKHKGLPVSDTLATLLSDTATMRQILQHLAYAAHLRQSRVADQKARQQPATLQRQDIITLIDNKRLLPLGVVDKFLGYVDKRAGLLRGLGGSEEDEQPNEYDFPHRTFQEYLAGCQMVTGLDYTVKNEYWQRAGEGDYWYIAAQYGAETLLYSDQPQRERLLDLAYALCQAEPPGGDKGWRAALWSGQMAAQLGPGYIEANGQGDPPPGPAYLKRVKERLVAIMTEERLPAIERAEAGNVLARLGDPRPEVMTVDGMQFCYVPAGPFIMGSRDEDELARDNEKPQSTFSIEYGYWLGRYPVTVAQWQEFVTGSGHEPRDQTSLDDPANRPMRYATWYESVEFCEWLTKWWREAGVLPQDWQVRLPSEMEWEKAARGGLEIPGTAVIGRMRDIKLTGTATQEGLGTNPVPQRRYPWDNEADPNCANYIDTGIGTTSAVGCFPEGVTPYGCEEMSGSVWEWCATKWQGSYQNYKNDNTIDKTDVIRILRGGAFDGHKRSIRCAFRDYYLFHPNERDDHRGFRVCLSPLLISAF